MVLHMTSHDRALPLAHLVSHVPQIRQTRRIAAGHTGHKSSAHVGHDRHSVLVKLQSGSKVLDDVGGRLQGRVDAHEMQRCRVLLYTMLKTQRRSGKQKGCGCAGR